MHPSHVFNVKVWQHARVANWPNFPEKHQYSHSVLWSGYKYLSGPTARSAVLLDHSRHLTTDTCPSIG
jgi:hypothetical protein